MSNHLKFVFILLIVFAAACTKKETTSDNWETPDLHFKKESDNTSQSVVVTPSFSAELAANDQFEFSFRRTNPEKQKSISNVNVSAKCAQDVELTKDVFSESFDLGSTVVFLAKELLPPTSIFENAKTLFCAWTLTISNEIGSTRTYSLPKLKIALTKLEAPIKLFTSDQKEVELGATIDPTNSKGLSFTVPQAGPFGARLFCDLTTIDSQSDRPFISEFLTNASNDEKLRAAHPMQRCLVEVRTGEGRVFRSGSYNIYLYPEPLSSVVIKFATAQEAVPLNNILRIGSAVLKNLSRQPRTFAFYGSNLPYDILFFDDRGIGGRPEYLPQSNVFRFQRKLDGQMRAVAGPSLKITAFMGQELILLQPHEQIEVELYLHFNIAPNCRGGGEFSIAGLRIPLGGEILGERSPYEDKKGNKINLFVPSNTALLPNSPLPNFIKLIHQKLFYPRVYERGFQNINSEC